MGEDILYAHHEEVATQDAEFINLGWATGEDFIQSKTTRGRLLTQKNHNGTITHKWTK